MKNKVNDLKNIGYVLRVKLAMSNFNNGVIMAYINMLLVSMFSFSLKYLKYYHIIIRIPQLSQKTASEIW
jgi:hypothetical protein